MKKRHLIVKPRSGLANRMRVISSCIYLKEQLNADMTVIWPTDKGLNAKYSDIFESNPHFKILSSWLKYRFILSHKRLIYSDIYFIRWISSFWNKFICSFLKVNYCIFDREIIKGYDHVKKIVENHSVVFIHTCSEFYDYPDGIRSFLPVPSILEKINNHSILFKNNTVGIHIRRTDNSLAVDKSPTILFERKIEEYLLRNSSLKFYVATDDPKIEKFLLEKFPDNVIIYSKTYGRDTLEGMVDAVVELYLLSRTSKIYGSYWSSYSEMASRLSNINLQILSVN